MLCSVLRGMNAGTRNCGYTAFPAGRRGPARGAVHGPIGESAKNKHNIFSDEA